ncbi:MAG: TonB-dependent receptor, partial [Robiginitomaculum sp.]|nr:TonB-dependent receptor [Robiginitomaculum sp.]
MMNCKQFIQAPLTLLVLALCGQDVAQAQIQVQAPNTNHDEIIVTATKRARNVQDVAISMTVFREQDIEILRTSRLSELSQFIPNMYLPPAGEAGQNDMTIRGVGGRINRSAGRAVGVYIDGVYISADTALNIGLADIQQVEVLRGPQGTLFGRNTIGGAVNITSRQEPLSNTDMTGRVQLEIGSLGHRKILGRVNIPLVKNRLSASLSGLQTKADGYIRNLNGGQNLGREDHSAYQVQLNFAPTDKLSGRLHYSTQKIDDNPNSQGEPITNIGADQIPYTVNTDQDERQTQNAQRSSLHLTYETDLGYSLQSISAWSDVQDFYIQDGDRLPQAITVNQFDGANEDISQEFRIVSPTLGRFDFVAGLYYFTEDTDRVEEFKLQINSVAGQNTLGNEYTRTQNKSTSYAAYGQAQWDFADRWSMLVGGRFSNDKKDYTATAVDCGQTEAQRAAAGFANFPNCQGVGGSLSMLNETFERSATSSFDDFSPMASLQFRPKDDVMLFATIATGYKSGGFAGSQGVASAATTPVLPEQVTNYEIGFKSTLADGSVRLNATGFFMDYRDLQIVRFGPVAGSAFGSFLTTNIGSADIFGLEVELDWA